MGDGHPTRAGPQESAQSMNLCNQGKGLMDEWRCRAVSKTEAEEVAIEPLLTLKEAEPEQTTGRDWGAANLKASGTGSQESAKTSVASLSYPGQMRAN